MSEILISALLAGGVAALIADALVPLVARVGVVLEAMDHPGGRRTHDRAVSRLGGIAILTGLVCGAGSVALLKWIDWGSPLPRQDLVAIMLGTGMIFLVGLVDDVAGVSVWKKFLVQIIAASLLVNLGDRWQFELLGLPGGGELELGMASGVLTVCWIVGVTNAINLIDGLDGLATGVAAIIAGSFLIFSFFEENSFVVVLTAGLVGACLGFLRHNREPARIFMGDAGSLTLGFLLAASSVNTGLKSPTAVAILVPLLALGVPVIDTLLVMGVRFVERPHGPLFRRVARMFSADQNHLHHLLESLLTNRRGAVRTIYGLVVFSSVLALSVALTKSPTIGFVLVVVEVVVVVLVRQMGMARRARDQARRRRRQIDSEAEAEQRVLRNRQLVVPMGGHLRESPPASGTPELR